MANIVLDLEDKYREFVERTAAERGVEPSGYVRELVRAAYREWALDRLEEFVLEGVNSGDPIEVTPEFWEDQRRRMNERLAAKKRTVP